MSSVNITFLEDEVWAVESPVDVVEGESVTFACTYWDTPSSPSAKAYRRNLTVTTTVFPTNSPTASGSVVTLSPATGLVGGGRYVIAVTATVDSDTRVRKIMLKCAKDEAEQ